MYVTVLPTRPPLFRPGGSPASQDDADRMRYYRYGRDALFVGLEMLGLGPDCEVLLPASLCEVVLLAFMKRGIRLRYYGLNAGFEPSVDELESRLGPRTRAIYVNHFLGRPTEMRAVRALCDRRGIALIEDCAHAYGATSDGGPVGTVGDIAIFSYRKFLPIADGGGLRVNSIELPLPEALPVRTGTAGWAGAKAAIAWAGGIGLLPLATIQRWRGTVESYLDPQDNLDAGGWIPPAGISAESQVAIRAADMQEVTANRRDNYRLWTQVIAGIKGPRPVFPDLADGQSPFCFPILVEQRDDFVRAMSRHGFYLEPTVAPPYRRIETLENPTEPFPEMQTVADHLVSLPVHQSLTGRQRDRLAGAISAFFR
ncbi:DegT/DnrJ/EryC1/StrS family aminotransferase [Devosia sp. Root436]|uniref:DegT/DnrJ/EryC1/StrS family aminotransferase n=1 Tax=Devosia sp. Root436 TaxID=1736537 RepID=UPI0009E9CC6F|nr:DegT/DnrJ/EryC1/StrS family aminotransferase [Devosia sp. Root436]